jgi:predicted Zn-dependent protease
LTEAEINRLGYLLLDAGRVGDAVRIFERNTQRFPRSGNVYDSLGEAYAAAGEREKAITAYERALTLDPTNTNAVVMLQKLRDVPNTTDPEDGRADVVDMLLDAGVDCRKEPYNVRAAASGKSGIEAVLRKKHPRR